MSSPPVDLIVFDAGGVLLRICRSWKEACARAGIPYHADVMDPAGVARRHQLIRSYETGGMACDAFFPALARCTAGRYTIDQVRSVHAAWTMDEYTGVTDLAADLRRRGVATALLSNTNAAHWTVISKYPVMGQLRSLFASHLLRAAKPDMRAFQEVSEATKTPASRILFFDDLPDNIAGAAAAGWQPHLVDHAGDTAAQMRQVLQARGILSW